MNEVRARIVGVRWDGHARLVKCQCGTNLQIPVGKQKIGCPACERWCSILAKEEKT